MAKETSQYIRPPVVAILGHVDHGKSTLLDSIRHTNVVDNEAGGITQCVSAYEVLHRLKDGQIKKITFIDTPGHAAFQGIRASSTNIADMAILIVAADDGVKPQTIQALNTINESKIPYIVAINKIDKADANLEKTKRELLEAGVYLEGMGGDISYVEISARKGTNIDELLETILLLAEFVDLSYNPNNNASGFVIESHIDSRRGIAATILIKDGVLRKSDFVVSGCSMVPCRNIYNFNGEPIDEASVSSPVTLFGFSCLCLTDQLFTSFHNKIDAETEMSKACPLERYLDEIPEDEEITIIPIIIKCDVMGSVDAVINEIKKLCNGKSFFKIVYVGVGPVTEADIRLIAQDQSAIIVSFNTGVDPKAKAMDEFNKITYKSFDIIYKMTEWLELIAEDRKFTKQIEVVTGSGQVLKVFSYEKKRALIGVKVANGELRAGDLIRIIRNREDISRGKIISIQAGKNNVPKVEERQECGIMIEVKHPPQPYDVIESIERRVE